MAPVVCKKPEGPLLKRSNARFGQFPSTIFMVNTCTQVPIYLLVDTLILLSGGRKNRFPSCLEKNPGCPIETNITYNRL